jgi:Transposase IS66 family
MAAWVAQCEALLDPLVAALGCYVLAADKVHADDTPVPVLEPGRGKTKTGRLWVYVRDGRPAADQAAPAAWYRYSPDRKGEHPQDHLAASAAYCRPMRTAGTASNTQFGVIAKINRRTATIETSDQKTWRVDFELLRHVVEV